MSSLKLKIDASYADQSMKVVIIPTDAPIEATMHTLEGGVEDLIEGDSCVVVQDGGTMTPIAPEGSCFELTVGTGDMSTFNMDTTGMTGFAAFTAHSPYEFENTQHYLKDSAGNNVEHIAEEGGGGVGCGPRGDVARGARPQVAAAAVQRRRRRRRHASRPVGGRARGVRRAVLPPARGGLGFRFF